MSRPVFAHGLGPTPWEYFVFLLWLAIVLLSMTAMALKPAFNLLFWPTLWTYDLCKGLRRRAGPSPRLRPRSIRASDPLWDRQLDG